MIRRASAQSYPEQPHYEPVGSVSALTGRNQYLASYIAPHLHSALIPDSNQYCTLPKKVPFSHTVTGHERLLFHITPDSALTSVQVYTAGNDNDWTLIETVPPGQQLADSYDFQRTVTSCWSVYSNTIPTGSFGVNGLLFAANTQSSETLQFKSPEEICMNRVDDYSYLLNVPISEGVTVVGSPSANLDFRRTIGPSNQSAGPTWTLFKRREAFNTVGSGDGENMPLNYVLMPTGNIGYLFYASGPQVYPTAIEKIPPFLRGKTTFTVSCNIALLNDLNGGNLGGERYITVVVTGVDNTFTTYRQSLRNGLVDKGDKPTVAFTHDSVVPIRHFACYYENIAGTSVVNGTIPLLLEVSVTNQNVFVPGETSNSLVICAEGLDPAATITMNGLINYEVVPNARFSREISSMKPEVNRHSSLDMDIVRIVSCNKGHFGIQGVYNRRDYETKTSQMAMALSDRQTSVGMAWSLSDITDHVWSGFKNFIKGGTQAALPSDVADPLLSWIGLASSDDLENVGYAAEAKVNVDELLKALAPKAQKIKPVPKAVVNKPLTNADLEALGDKINHPPPEDPKRPKEKEIPIMEARLPDIIEAPEEAKTPTKVTSPRVGKAAAAVEQCNWILIEDRWRQAEGGEAPGVLTELKASLEEDYGIPLSQLMVEELYFYEDIFGEDTDDEDGEPDVPTGYAGDDAESMDLGKYLNEEVDDSYEEVEDVYSKAAEYDYVDAFPGAENLISSAFQAKVAQAAISRLVTTSVVTTKQVAFALTTAKFPIFLRDGGKLVEVAFSSKPYRNWPGTKAKPLKYKSLGGGLFVSEQFKAGSVKGIQTVLECIGASVAPSGYITLLQPIMVDGTSLSLAMFALFCGWPNVFAYSASITATPAGCVLQPVTYLKEKIAACEQAGIKLLCCAGMGYQTLLNAKVPITTGSQIAMGDSFNDISAISIITPMEVLGIMLRQSRSLRALAVLSSTGLSNKSYLPIHEITKVYDIVKNIDRAKTQGWFEELEFASELAKRAPKKFMEGYTGGRLSRLITKVVNAKQFARIDKAASNKKLSADELAEFKAKSKILRDMESKGLIDMSRLDATARNSPAGEALAHSVDRFLNSYPRSLNSFLGQLSRVPKAKARSKSARFIGMEVQEAKTPPRKAAKAEDEKYPDDEDDLVNSFLEKFASLNTNAAQRALEKLPTTVQDAIRVAYEE